MRAATLGLLVVRASGLLAAQPPPQSAQAPPPPATGLIMGRVVEATTGAPVAGAYVRTSRNDVPIAIADAAGQFVFGGLPARVS